MRQEKEATFRMPFSSINFLIAFLYPRTRHPWFWAIYFALGARCWVRYDLVRVRRECIDVGHLYEDYTRPGEKSDKKILKNVPSMTRYKRSSSRGLPQDVHSLPSDSKTLHAKPYTKNLTLSDDLLVRVPSCQYPREEDRRRRKRREG